MIRRVLLLAVTCIVLASAAVVFLRGGESIMKPYYRLSDPRWRLEAQPESASSVTAGTADTGGGTSDFPVATIMDETRYVLSSPARASVLVQRNVVVPPDGRLSFSPALPPALQDAERIVLAAGVRSNGRLTNLPSVLGGTEIVDSKRVVSIRLALPAETSGSTADIYVEGFAATDSPTSVWHTSNIPIPPGARMEFGIGILEPAWSQEPVTFDLKACAGEVCESLFSEVVGANSDVGRGWQDRSVALDGLAGQTRSFLFETHHRASGTASFSLPVWANPTVYAPVKRTRGDANVILLSIDTLRADHLTSYGYQQNTAPFIEETFGKGGTIFEHCVAAASSTPPSHMTMFTSLQPCAHGLRTGFEVLPAWAMTLAETLRASGFETGAVTEDAFLGINQGFGRGFNSYVENKGTESNFPEGQVAITFEKAKEWLARNREKRFFLFVHTYQVHSPYTPPDAYLTLFAQHDGQPVTPASPRYLRDLIAYDREIRYTDDQLRSLFEAITTNGLADNTIFILISDHGEGFLEHGFLRHGAHLYEEVTRVPLMFWGPGRIPHGRRVPEPVGHIDLMPTILDLAGVAKSAQLMGTSFSHRLQATAPNPAAGAGPHFSEGWGHVAAGPNYEAVPFEAPAYMVQVSNHKLMRYRHNGSFVYEYYDLEDAAVEGKNLYAERAADVGDLRTVLDTYENTCKAAAMNLAMQSQRPVTQGPEPVQLDPAQEEKLRALGYVK